MPHVRVWPSRTSAYALSMATDLNGVQFPRRRCSLRTRSETAPCGFLPVLGHLKRRFVDLARHLSLVRDTVGKVSSRGFSSLSTLSTLDPWTMEVGDPNDHSPEGYCQLEAELLDTFVEEGMQALHLPVTADATNRTLGADVFVGEDGQATWNGQVHEFIDGGPRLLDCQRE